MNIHPLFVHFPIALLTVYALLELLRFKKLISTPWFFYVKGAFVCFGFLGALVALQTGELIEDLFERGPSGQLMETHATFATASTILFGVLAGLYVVTWLQQVLNEQKWLQQNGIRQLWQVVLMLQKILYRPWILILSAFAGLILVTITGALGGALVYGPEVDPVVAVIYGWFF